VAAASWTAAASKLQLLPLEWSSSAAQPLSACHDSDMTLAEFTQVEHSFLGRVLIASLLSF